MTPDGTPAEPLVMPRDEFELVRWVLKVSAGPSFPADAEAACRLAAKLNWSGTGRVHALLAEAAGKARPAGDEAKLAAIAEHCRDHARPAKLGADSPPETVVRAADILAIIGTEALEPEPLSAVCSGCGDGFADEESGEYLFTSEATLVRLLYANGWMTMPPLCPACQPGND